MTNNKFLAAGTKVLLPTGQSATFVRWQIRLVQPGDATQGQERVAVLRTGCNENLHLSEKFMVRVRIC